MQVNQDVIDMLSGPDRGSASTCIANQPKSRSKDTMTPDLVSKGSGELPSQSTQVKDDPMDGGCKETPSDKRERESRAAIFRKG